MGAASTSTSEIAVVASAPGKVILFGEHAVVYGKTAVGAAVSDLRIVVTAVRVSPRTIVDERTFTASLGGEEDACSS